MYEVGIIGNSVKAMTPFLLTLYCLWTLMALAVVASSPAKSSNDQKLSVYGTDLHVPLEQTHKFNGHPSKLALSTFQLELPVSRRPNEKSPTPGAGDRGPKLRPLLHQLHLRGKTMTTRAAKGGPSVEEITEHFTPVLNIPRGQGNKRNSFKWPALAWTTHRTPKELTKTDRHSALFAHHKRNPFNIDTSKVKPVRIYWKAANGHTEPLASPNPISVTENKRREINLDRSIYSETPARLEYDNHIRPTYKLRDTKEERFGGKPEKKLQSDTNNIILSAEQRRTKIGSGRKGEKAVERSPSLTFTGAGGREVLTDKLGLLPDTFLTWEITGSPPSGPDVRPKKNDADSAKSAGIDRAATGWTEVARNSRLQFHVAKMRHRRNAERRRRRQTSKEKAIPSPEPSSQPGDARVSPDGHSSATDGVNQTGQGQDKTGHGNHPNKSTATPDQSPIPDTFHGLDNWTVSYKNPSDVQQNDRGLQNPSATSSGSQEKGSTTLNDDGTGGKKNANSSKLEGADVHGSNPMTPNDVMTTPSPAMATSYNDWVWPIQSDQTTGANLEVPTGSPTAEDDEPRVARVKEKKPNSDGEDTEEFPMGDSNQTENQTKTSEHRSTPEPSGEPKPTSEPEPGLTPEPEPESTSEPKPEPESTSEPKPEPESTSEPKSTPEAKPEPESTPEPELESTPEPEPESTAEPASEPGLVSNSVDDATAEPEQEVIAEPKPKPEPEPEPEGRGREDLSKLPSAEPGPEWVAAKAMWQEAWEVHIYAFGGLFAAVGAYTLLSLVRLWRIQRLLSKPYFISLNVLMLLMCATRSFYLLYDPYNSNNTFPISLDYFLYSIAFPCLTSAFSVLLYSLLKATHMQLVSPSVQRLPVLTFIVVSHFVLSIATDILLGMYAGMQVMLFVCQVYFILWGLFLFFGYAHIFRKIYAHAVKRQKNLYDQSPGTASRANGKSRYTLSTAIKVTFFTAICGLVTVALEVYAIVEVYKTFTRDRPKPWPWWLYHTVLRLIEFLMVLTMSYVASQPFRYKSGNKNANDGTDGCCSCCNCGVLCAPCAEIVCCGHTINRPGSAAGWNEIEFQARATSNLQTFENGTRDSYNTGSTRHLYLDDLTDCTPIVNQQPPPARTSTLRRSAEENSYVRFDPGKPKPEGNQGEPPYSEIYPGKDTQAHSVSTFRLRDGFVNTGYALNVEEPKKMPSDGLAVNGLENSSPRNSESSNDFFKAPSSVSLANSMENELEKVFESFRLDSSADDDPDNKSIDLIIASNLPNMKETDLLSVDSFPETKEDFAHPGEISACSELKSPPEAQATIQEELVQLRDSPSPRVNSSVRRVKSSELEKNHHDNGAVSPNHEALSRSLSDKRWHRTNSDNNYNVKYSCLLEMEPKGAPAHNTEGMGHDRDLDRRRPNEGQGQEAAFLTSLLKSGYRDDVDV